MRRRCRELDSARSRRRLARGGAAALLVAALAFAGTVAGVRLRRTPPAPAVSIGVPASVVPSPGDAPPVALPAAGSAVVSADDGVLAARAGDTVRPIGSVAKTMTALAVLAARPLAPGEPGPVHVIDGADVAGYRAVVAAEGSSLAVTAGEALTERDLLLALLLPSANNIADTLARWVSGSVPAFVDLLNRTAARLSMSHTHFADPSGYSPQTVSTAADLVRLGRAALAVPALAALVATSHATLPDGRPLDNLDTLLTSEPGWLGVKTGETPSAGGCLLFASRRAVAGGSDQVTVVGAVLGQPHLAGALEAARAAVDSAFAGYVDVPLADLVPPLTGGVVAAWGERSGLRISRPSGAVALRRGARVAIEAAPLQAPAPLAAGATVGVVTAVAPGHRWRWTVLTAAGIGDPSPWWRLSH